jgi:hypothetical protein
LKQDLSIVVVDDLAQLIGVGPTEVFGGQAKERIHEAEAGRESQREVSAQRVGLGELVRRPVVAEGAVASARDAADVAQSAGIDVGGGRKRPGPALRPARHAEFVRAQRVGDRYKVVRPAGVGAVLLLAGLPYAGSVHADEP